MRIFALVLAGRSSTAVGSCARFPVRCAMGAALALVLLGVIGCAPGGARSDELDQNVLAGRSFKDLGEYDRAMDAFERALRNNPNSAAAHYELGLIHYQRSSDYIGALYHFDRFLRLRPRANQSNIVSELQRVCRQEVAKSIPMNPLNHAMQREIERLIQTNEFLAKENERLRLEVAQLKLPLDNPQVRSNTAPLVRGPAVADAVPEAETSSVPRQAYRTHVIRSGETLAALSRRYGVSIRAITAANPGVNPSRLRVGQTVNIPAP